MKTNQSIDLNKHLSDGVYWKEFFYLIVTLMLLVFLVSFASFDPSDATIFNLANTINSYDVKHHNIFGPWGATLADWGVQLFGIGAIVFSGVFFCQVLATFRRPSIQSRWTLRIWGYPQLIIAYLGLVTGIHEKWQFRGASFYRGGLIGHQIFWFLSKFFGYWGAICVLCFALIVSLPLCLGLGPLSGLTALLQSRWFSRSSRSATILQKWSGALKELQEPDFELPPKLSSSALLKKDEDKQLLSVQPPRGTGVAEHFQALKEYLTPPTHLASPAAQDELLAGQELLVEKLLTFGVQGKVLHSQAGPVVNVYEFEPAAGVKVTKVLAFQDDLALALRAHSVLMAPQAGKSTIGIEVPAQRRQVVNLREILESDLFKSNTEILPIALGKKVDGSPLIADLSTMPHLLVAGATGSGKSVGINTLLLSLLMTKTPEQLRLILVDPKMLELSQYNGIGHLLAPVVTEPVKAAAALRWGIQEMERRYQLMQQSQARNISAYNASVHAQKQLPYIVIVIDELCDLMMTAPRDVEESIQRLAQKARAAGIHLILATQRPSVDVLTGVIKANLPCRIAFQVASRFDSRTIIEAIGAERLLGKGDMLFLPPGTHRLIRGHGAYVTDSEIHKITEQLRVVFPAQYLAALSAETSQPVSSLASVQ